MIEQLSDAKNYMQSNSKISFDAEMVATFLAAMANPVRLDVLIALSNGERDVGSLAQQLGIAQSALSQHLAKLRKPGLVKCRRDQKRILYFIADAKIPTMLWMFNTMFRS